MLLLDADFLPNRALSDLVHDPVAYEQLRRVTGYRQGIVLPAFETIDDGEEGKAAALKAIKSERALEHGLAWLELQLSCIERGGSRCAGCVGRSSFRAALNPPTSPPPPSSSSLPPGRDALHELFKRGELRGFHMDHYNRGHRCVAGMSAASWLVRWGAG